MADALAAHLERFAALGRHPTVLAEARQLKEEMEDVIYPLGQGIHAHLHLEKEGWTYEVVEPALSDTQLAEVAVLRERVAREAALAGDRLREGSLHEGLSAILAKVHGRIAGDPVAER